MCRWLKYFVVVMAIVGAWTIMPSVAGAAGIAGTPHDLSATAPGGQICITCHTPHMANETLLLWNHFLSSNTYSWSDATATTAGTSLPLNIDTWTGSTKKCLSCHDGTVEIGKLYSTGATFDATKVTGDHIIGTTTGDLKGNHPVAIPYPFGGVPNIYNGITSQNVVAAAWQSAPTKVKLFSDGTPTGTNRGIECASCHNPHDNTNIPYLRDVTTGSQICLDCHVK